MDGFDGARDSAFSARSSGRLDLAAAFGDRAADVLMAQDRWAALEAAKVAARQPERTTWWRRCSAWLGMTGVRRLTGRAGKEFKGIRTDDAARWRSGPAAPSPRRRRA
jgi:hypothetical protein